MGKSFYRFLLAFLIICFGIGGFFSGVGLAAEGTGGFQVPNVNDHFNEVEKAPAPKKEEIITQKTKKEEKGFFEKIGDGISDAWDTTKNAVSDAWDATKKTVSDAVDWVVDAAVSTWNWVVDVAVTTWNWVVDAAVTTWNWVVDAAVTTWNWVVDAAVSTWNWVVDAAVSTWNWVVDAAVTTWNWITDTASDIWDGITKFFAKIKEIIVENAIFTVGVVLLSTAAGAVFLLRKIGKDPESSSMINNMTNAGKSLVGVDTNRPNGTMKDVKVSDKTLANASQLVYKDNISNKDVEEWLGEDWKVTSEKVDLGNGLQSQVFINHNTKELVIAFRGTETKFNDIVIADGNIGMGMDVANPQMIAARKFVESVKNNPDYNGYQFVLTGHSLGGYLAVDSGSKYKIPTVTFNAAGKNLFPSANLGTVFGGLGGGATIYMSNMIIDPDTRKQAINEKINNYDDLIHNYNFNHDLVGGVGYRPGQTFQVDENQKVTKDEDLDNDLNVFNLNTNFDSHSISNFTGKDDNFKDKDTPLNGVYDKDGNIAPRK